ncbi:MAG: hypothetical protein ABI873_10030 [Marmoricola sp.]
MSTTMDTNLENGIFTIDHQHQQRRPRNGAQEITAGGSGLNGRTKDCRRSQRCYPL